MDDYINFTEEEFLKLTLEEIKASDINKIKIKDELLIFYLIGKEKFDTLKNLIEYNESSSTINLNIKNDYGSTPLHRSCYKNNLEMAKLLLSRGVEVNIKNYSQDTPLMYVCYENNFELAKLLLSRGAEVNVKNTYNETPLSFACYRRNNLELISLLLENGAIPEVDEKGKYECLKYIGIKGENKEKLRDFIFEFQSRNIKKCIF